MALFALVLHYEYNVFFNQLLQLANSNEDQSFGQSMQQWYESEPDEDDDSAEEEVTEQENMFCIVNRDIDYLKEASQDFTKKHNVAVVTQDCYDPHGVWAKTEQHFNPKKKQFLQKKQVIRRVVNKPGILQCPIDREQYWLSSRFGSPRKKADGTRRFHYGIDMAAQKNTPVKSAALGTVVEAGVNNGFGNTIVIRHADGIYHTRYAHLNTIFVSRGQRVVRGQKIATVGNTGSVRGENGGKNAYHLHFEVKQQGKHIDPLRVISI